MFKIIEEKQNDLKRLKILNENTGEYLSVIPRFGANLNEIVLKKSNKLYGIIDGNKDSDSFEDKGIYKSANLLPFPNRLKNGKYTFNGADYQLPQNYKDEGNAAHGFIYDKSFELINTIISEKEAQVILRYDYDGSIPGYPFPLRIQYDYKLSIETGFQCHTKVHNLAHTEIPFGCGWHPFFTLNEKVDKLKLKFNAEDHILFDGGLIPNGMSENFNQFETFSLINGQPFDSCFKLPETSNIQYTELLDEVENLKIVLWQETGLAKYNYLQLYIPPLRESIAIEPMTCNVNAFNNQDGLIRLKSGQKFTAKYGVQLK